MRTSWMMPSPAKRSMAYVFDAATDQLAGLGMVVETEAQVLDVVVQLVAQVESDARRHPFTQIGVPKIQEGGRYTDTQDDPPAIRISR